MKHIGARSFTDMLYEELDGKLPGSTSHKRSPSRKLLRTPANERARENFEYWYKEAKPVNHGKNMLLFVHRYLILFEAHSFFHSPFRYKYLGKSQNL